MIRVQIKMADVSTNAIPLQDKSFADATKDLNCIRTGEIACVSLHELLLLSHSSGPGCSKVAYH